ncbi:hypothetical protein Tco_0321691 [Tanacetum coccineum]
MDPRNCFCGLPTIIWTSWTAANPGRRFHGKPMSLLLVGGSRNVSKIYCNHPWLIEKHKQSSSSSNGKCKESPKNEDVVMLAADICDVLGVAADLCLALGVAADLCDAFGVASDLYDDLGPLTAEA